MRVNRRLRPSPAARLADDLVLVAGCDLEQVMGDRGVADGLDRVDGMHAGSREVPAHEHVDVAVQRRREQQPLRPGARRIEQAPDGGQEALVGHVVGLVDDRHLDRAEAAVAERDQVLEAAGAGDEDVDAAPQRRDLRPVRDAAEDGGDGQVDSGRERSERLRDLAGELTGRHEHECTRMVPGGAAASPRPGPRRPAARTRPSCRYRCGRGRGCLGRRARRAGSPPGSGTARGSRRRRGRRRARGDAERGERATLAVRTAVGARRRGRGRAGGHD